MDQDGIRHLNFEKSIQGEVILGDEYVDSDTSLQILGKLDKRQESDLDSSEAYPPSPHIPEFEKQSEIQEVAEVSHWNNSLFFNFIVLNIYKLKYNF